jgi:predicted metal-dependent hydrolase
MMQRLLQFTLDLFDSAPAPLPKAAGGPKAKKSKPKRPVAQVPYAHPAIENIAEVEFTGPQLPAQTLQQALAPATFRHPRATRETVLGGRLVAYEFRRSKRIDWKDGTTLPFLGDQVIVVIDPRHAFGGVGAELKTSEANGTLPGVAQLTLHVGLPQNASAEQIRDAVQAWLMRQAKRVFIERLNHFAPQLGVQWHKLSLSSAGTRWGSASADGSIRLNWRLIHFKLSVIDYVVVHELSHLRVMDHSPRFWDTVRTVVPDYAELRGQLKDEAIPRW